MHDVSCKNYVHIPVGRYRQLQLDTPVCYSLQTQRCLQRKGYRHWQVEDRHKCGIESTGHRHRLLYMFPMHSMHPMLHQLRSEQIG